MKNDIGLSCLILFAGFLLLGAMEATRKDPAWLLSLIPGLTILIWARVKSRRAADLSKGEGKK